MNGHSISNHYNQQYNDGTYNMANSRQIPGAGYPGLPVTPAMAAAAAATPVMRDHTQLWKQPSVRPEIVSPSNVQYNNSQGQYRYDSASSSNAAAAAAQYHLQYNQYGQQLDPATLALQQQQQINWQQQQMAQHMVQQQHHHSGHHRSQSSSHSHINIPVAPSTPSVVHASTSSSSRMLPADSDINNSLFQVFESTSTQEPHFLYCKKCALLKPAVEFASTTGFFNNNCKHCRNYRRKGEDAKSEAVQEIYRVTSYEQLKSTLSECIHSRRVRNAPLVCVHFYLDLNFIGDRQTQEPIGNDRFLTPEGRSALANMLIKQVRTVDNYSYNHRSTRVFKSGETHKYLCSQSTALPWRQKKKGPNGEMEYTDPDLHNCGGTILVKFQSPGEHYQRVCVAYCHDVSHPPKAAKIK